MYKSVQHQYIYTCTDCTLSKDSIGWEWVTYGNIFERFERTNQLNKDQFWRSYRSLQQAKHVLCCWKMKENRYFFTHNPSRWKLLKAIAQKPSVALLRPILALFLLLRQKPTKRQRSSEVDCHPDLFWAHLNIHGVQIRTRNNQNEDVSICQWTCPLSETFMYQNYFTRFWETQEKYTENHWYWANSSTTLDLQ